MDVARAQCRTLQIAELVEHEQRLVAGAGDPMPTACCLTLLHAWRRGRCPFYDNFLGCLVAKS
jgi:hypothetical protein